MSDLPTLSQSLQGRDLGHLKIIAQCWELEFDAPDGRVGLQRLVELLLKREHLVQVVKKLPAGAQAALADLYANQGRMSWALFGKRYGAVREIGPARRDREQPHLEPISPAEILWYRALLGRGFFDTDKGPEEFAYIPEDLLERLPRLSNRETEVLGRPATPADRVFTNLTSDRILDHACTLLAALRMGLSEEQIATAWDEPPGASPPYWLKPAHLKSILRAAGLLGDDDLPIPEPTRAFLEAPRSEALKLLFESWRTCSTFDELRTLPGILAEGEWSNDPMRTRQVLLNYFDRTPLKTWWNLPSFVNAIKQNDPDFQRPAGDYDSWFLKDILSGEYLRGFEKWDEVEGRLIRYFVGGPLYWLAVVDLARPDEGAACLAFRSSEWAYDLIKGNLPIVVTREDMSIQVSSEARIRIPRLAPRAARYQIARFCTWEGFKNEVYQYRITPASLSRARHQGLRSGQLMTLLRRYAQTTPPALGRALERWEEHGVEARLDEVVILRVSNAEMLQTIRNSRAGRFLGDPLSQTAIIVKTEAVGKVLTILAELGYLGEVRLGGEA